jgi:hypothetical protein
MKPTYLSLRVFLAYCNIVVEMSRPIRFAILSFQTCVVRGNLYLSRNQRMHILVVFTMFVLAGFFRKYLTLACVAR